ncbi:uncharacterized protein LOC135477903 isoform X2 [Liolophura sinensis]|uniref:uncharacterized protein LOC135477903 isoform X2 n=1 Tax=Liolophura sinensis TaxID=3198878 RepID=UPI0031597ABF
MTTKERRLTRGMTREVDPYLSEEDTSQEDLEVMGPRRPGSNGTRRLGRNGTQRPGSNGTRDRGFTFENDQQLVCGSEQKHDSLKDDADFNAIMGAATTGFALGVGGYFLREILDGLQSGLRKNQCQTCYWELQLLV